MSSFQIAAFVSALTLAITIIWSAITKNELPLQTNILVGTTFILFFLHLYQKYRGKRDS